VSLDARQRDALQSVRPGSVALYLRSQQWEQVSEDPRSTTWVKRGADGREIADVLVPSSRDLRDFITRMAEVLCALQRVEGRTYNEILDSLASTYQDALRIRVASRATADGTLPLVRGAIIIPRIEELIGAAASSALQRRRVHKRRSGRVQEFLRHARLGQTQRGSYVVTIVSELTTPETLFEEPFERRVLGTLASALDAVDGAVRAEDRVAAFDASVAKGVSANLCRALSALGSSEGHEQIEFQFTWAAVRPAHALRSAFTFDTSAMPVIEEAARYLGAEAPRDGFVLRGWVKQLRHEDPNFWNVPGAVIIEAHVDEAVRGVSVQLAPDDHLKAVRAYESGAPVICVGELIHEGKSYRLENPRRFVIADVTP
jgi:hypothetical protein